MFVSFSEGCEFVPPALADVLPDDVVFNSFGGKGTSNMPFPLKFSYAIVTNLEACIKTGRFKKKRIRSNAKFAL